MLNWKMDFVVAQVESYQSLLGQMEVLNALELVVGEVEALDTWVFPQNLTYYLNWNGWNLGFIRRLLDVGVLIDIVHVFFEI